MALYIEGMGGSMKIGIIGGTGFYEMEGEEIEVETKYGSVVTQHFRIYGRDIFFISRHGKKHAKPAHAVNYHANIMAMKNIGASVVIGVSTVGSMRERIKPGSIFIPNDFIDFTKRKTTFFDDVAIHIDLSEPFCPIVRKILKEASSKYDAVEGIYVATEGPRLETKAEIAMLKNFGDVVGMTLVPEAILAREAGICYASICLVSNYAAGLQSRLSIEEIKEMYKKRKNVVEGILKEAIKKIPARRNCRCKYAPIDGKL